MVQAQLHSQDPIAFLDTTKLTMLCKKQLQ